MRAANALSVALLLASGACTTATEPVADAVHFPLRTWVLAQDFGAWNTSRDGYHLAEDVMAEGGDSVFAIAAGVVRAVILNNEARGYGGIVLIEHPFGGETVTGLYGHLSTRRGTAVDVDQVVAPGDLVAFIADDDEDGGTWRPHLHFGIREGAYDRESRICGVWLYVGYTRDCLDATHDQQRDQWHDPSDFLTASGAVMPGP
jgi:murein DD-endopeptidase MepM/ murein hydrolase activator NlpD